MQATPQSPANGVFDTPQAFGPVSRALHWIMAALLLWQFCSAFSHFFLEDTAVESFFWGGHYLVGFSIFVLALLRGAWGLLNLSRRPPHVAGALGQAAVAGQTLMYVLMIGVPSLALLRAWGGTRGFELLGVQIFAPQTNEIEWTGALAGQFHGELGWVLFAAIAGHIAMAFLHPKFGGEIVLPRMGVGS